MSGLWWRIAARAGGLQTVEIALPELVLIFAELVQVFPRVEARVVAVGERGPQGIVPDGLDGLDGHLTLADLQRLLARTVAAHFCGRRVDPQVLVRQAK